MDLLLNEEEVKTAIVDYIKEQGISTSGCNIEVTLKAGRATAGNKAGGTNATVSISKTSNVVKSDSNVETTDTSIGMTDDEDDSPVLSASDLANKEEVESEALGNAENDDSIFS